MPTSRWSSTCARRCRRRRRSCGPRSIARPRGRRAPRPPTAGEDQALFGIVQGGVDEALRVESAERTVAIGFDGYAIGGLSVGERRDEMVPALRAATGVLPPTGSATSWASAIPQGSSRPWPPASTCSTACCRPATVGTARC